MSHACRRCTQPTDTTICNACSKRLRGTLNHIQSLWPALQQAIGKQTAMGARSGNKPTKASEQPLPVDMHASQVADRARGVLVGWVRVLAEDNQLSLPADTVPAMCSWLVAHLTALRRHEAAAEACDEITWASGDVSRAVDYPRERARVFTGPCPEDLEDSPCPGEVWAIIPDVDQGTPRMECSPPKRDPRATVCGEVWDATRWLRLGVRIKRREEQIRVQKSYGREVGA